MNHRTDGEWSNDPPRVRRWIGGLALVLVLVAGGAWLASRSQPKTSAPRASRPLPAFSLRGFDGRLVTDASLAGKPTVINFFASTCTFCIEEMPAFERVHARSGDRIMFLGVALRDSEEAARHLARVTGVTYRLAFDDTGSFYRAVRGIGMPVTVFVLDSGEIASVHLGPLDETRLQERIDLLFRGTA